MSFDKNGWVGKVRLTPTENGGNRSQAENQAKAELQTANAVLSDLQPANQEYLRFLTTNGGFAQIGSFPTKIELTISL